MRNVFIVLGAAVSVSACFALTDDVSGLHGPAPTVTNGDAGSDGDSAASPPRANDDLTVDFTGMYQHVNQLFSFVVVDRNNFVQTRGLVLPLKMTDGRFKISIPQAIPHGDGLYRLDFWADETLNGKYDFDHAWEKDHFAWLDHSWRISLDDQAPLVPFVTISRATGSGSYGVEFSHHLDFVDLNEFPDRQLPKNPPNDTGIPAVIHIDNLGAQAGKLAQIRVADPSGHVVGLFRFRTATQVDFFIAGCVEPGNYYDVDLYIDANDNNDATGKGYDDPSKGSGDLGWRLQHQPADDTGLHVTFDAAATATGNVDVGPP